MNQADIQSPSTLPSAAAKELSRAVFDALLDQDLLGLLLSSKHFAAFVKTMRFETRGDAYSLAKSISVDARQIHEFHQVVLAMYSGVYIAECKHKTQAALMADLDAKLATAINLPEAGNDDLDGEQVNRVEMAWRYRRTCHNSAKFAA